jgi:hypothetical protein
MLGDPRVRLIPGGWLRRFSVLVALSMAVTARGESSSSYRFTATSVGAYRSSMAGTVTVAGTRCRIDFDANPATVMEMTAVLCGDNGELLALNDANKTWFRLKSRRRLAISSNLFSFRDAAESKVRVTSEAPDPAGERDGMTGRVKFAYTIDVVVSGEPISGQVSGEIRIWSAANPRPKEPLPWNPVDIVTSLPTVDTELRRALAAFSGVYRAEATVSRRLANGETLTETVTRSMDWKTAGTSPPRSFVVPPDYRYLEPVLGTPGAP